MSHRFLPHTADLRAELRARDWPGLLGAGVDLVRDVLVDACAVEPRDERRVELPPGDEEEQLFRFLRELVYLYDSEGFLPAAVAAGEPLRVRGEPFDPLRHRSERQVKAVTRHGFRLARDPEGYRAEVLFDL
jgi:SHS2 domain-containing protein